MRIWKCKAAPRRNLPSGCLSTTTAWYDRYRQPVASLAVLADTTANWRPNHFGFAVLGCEHELRFPAVKLLDYAAQQDQLYSNPNPFALVTLAHLLTQATRQDT